VPQALRQAKLEWIIIRAFYSILKRNFGGDTIMITAISTNTAYTSYTSPVSKESNASPSQDEAMLERFREEIQNAHKQAGTMGESTASLGKALRIASRIMRGDIVPDQDDKFLLENYPEMHMRAWMLRMSKEDPTEYKSVLDDDKNKNTAEIPGMENPTGIPVPPALEASAAAVAAITELDVSA
jgi:hypothetical protein